MSSATPFADYALDQDSKSFFLDGLLTEGGTSLLVGEPKAGKSQLARHLISSLVSGGTFLDQQFKRSGNVIYYALEEHPGELKNQFLALGVPDDNRTLFLGGRNWEAKNPIQDLIENVEAIDPVLVVIDPFIAFSSLDDVNDYAAVYRSIRPLVQLAQRTGLHLMLVHHKNKSDGNNSRQVMGSQAFFGSTDSLLLLSGEESKKSLTVIPRYAIRQQFEFEMSPESLGEVFNCKGSGRKSTEEKIFIALEKHPEGIEQRVLAQGHNRSNFQSKISELEDLGLIIRERKSTNSPYIVKKNLQVPL